jgi:putative endonuclease
VFYTYVIFSKYYNRFYKGQSSNLENRLKEHNSGQTKSTKSDIPWEIVYYESLQTREEALNEKSILNQP